MSSAAHIRLLSQPLEDGGRLAELGPISPELALVDPDLARVARALLPDRPMVGVLSPLAPVLALFPAPAAGFQSSPVVSLPEADVPSTAADRVFVLRHFAAGLLLGLLLAALIVEVYVLLQPLRSGETSGNVPNIPRLVAPTPGDQPTVAADPESRRPPAGTVSSDRATSSPAPGSGAASPVPVSPGSPVPASPALVTPASPARTTTALAWPEKPGTVAYRVTLSQGGRPILVRTVSAPRLPLPARWRYAGEQHQLVPGTYRWLVVPLRRVGSTLRPGTPVVDAVYVVPPVP